MRAGLSVNAKFPMQNVQHNDHAKHIARILELARISLENVPSMTGLLAHHHSHCVERSKASGDVQGFAAQKANGARQVDRRHVAVLFDERVRISARISLRVGMETVSLPRDCVITDMISIRFGRDGALACPNHHQKSNKWPASSKSER